MYRTHASNPWIYGLVIASVVVVALVIWGVYRYWDVATSAKATEGQVLRMVILMGALGGAIHWMSSLVNYIGNGNFFRRWISIYWAYTRSRDLRGCSPSRRSRCCATFSR